MIDVVEILVSKSSSILTEQLLRQEHFEDAWEREVSLSEPQQQPRK